MMIWEVSRRSPAGRGSNGKDGPISVLDVIFIICTPHIIIFLQFDLTLERFYNVRVVFLLVYVVTTANGHNQPGFKVFHLV